MTDIVPMESIVSKIYQFRDIKVMLDADLAELYGVKTKVLIQAVKRNIERFPADFMFQLSEEEFAFMRSQTVTSNQRGGRRYLPYAFTEHGAIMLASVLKSKHAIDMSVYVVRAFIAIREMLVSNIHLWKKFEKLEKAVESHDEAIHALIVAMRELKPVAGQKKRQIGFQGKV